MFERKTTVSNKVLAILEETTSPLSVLQITNSLKQSGLEPNKTTIYRIIEKLVEKKAVAQVPFKNGVTYFELAKLAHHHHFFCNGCQSVFCLDTCHVKDQTLNLSPLLPSPKFEVSTHDFNVYGLCEGCLATPK